MTIYRVHLEDGGERLVEASQVVVSSTMGHLTFYASQEPDALPIASFNARCWNSFHVFEGKRRQQVAIEPAEEEGWA